MRRVLKKKVERILLVRPPVTIVKNLEPKNLAVPLGLAYLAAVLENDYEVKILDSIADGFEEELRLSGDFVRFGLSFEKIQEEIRAFSPDVVGISCLFSVQFANALEVCRIAKNVDKDIITVVGGAHVSALPEEAMQEDEIDFVVIGEGETTLQELVAAIEGKQIFTEIDGLAYRNRDDELVVNPKTRYIEDLDTIPFPARHLLPMEKYFAINRPHGSAALKTPNTSLVSSRGCPGRCIFCSIHTVWGSKFRKRSSANVLDEIEHLIEEYGVKEIQFGDDNLICDRKRAVEIFSGMISRRFDISWHGVGGVILWGIDEEMIRLMKKSGCYRLSIPVESGDQDVLKSIIKKPVDLAKVPSVIKIMNRYGIKTDAFFVIGLPGETRKQLQNTFSYARRLPVDNVNFFYATPFPGTELYKICQETKCLSSDFSYDLLRTGTVHIVTPEFTRKELERMVAKEMILLKLLLLFRKPHVFFEKVVLRCFRDSRYFFSVTMKLFRALLIR